MMVACDFQQNKYYPLTLVCTPAMKRLYVTTGKHVRNVGSVGKFLLVLLSPTTITRATPSS